MSPAILSVPDVARLEPGGQPRVRYYSGANGDPVGSRNFLTADSVGVALATVADGNGDGVADDPAIAVLADRSDGAHLVEVRRADTGAKIRTVEFLSDAWDVIDVAVIDDENGDGNPNDPVRGGAGLQPGCHG